MVSWITATCSGLKAACASDRASGSDSGSELAELFCSSSRGADVDAVVDLRDRLGGLREDFEALLTLRGSATPRRRANICWRLPCRERLFACKRRRSTSVDKFARESCSGWAEEDDERRLEARGMIED